MDVFQNWSPNKNMWFPLVSFLNRFKHHQHFAAKRHNSPLHGIVHVGLHWNAGDESSCYIPIPIVFFTPHLLQLYHINMISLLKTCQTDFVRFTSLSKKHSAVNWRRRMSPPRLWFREPLQGDSFGTSTRRASALSLTTGQQWKHVLKSTRRFCLPANYIQIDKST